MLVSAGVSFYLISTSTGTLVVRIHDSPSTWSNLTVTFSEVAVRPAQVGNASDWIVLQPAGMRIDFLAPGNLTRVLALDRLAPGTFTELRIVVTGVRGVPSGGSPVTMSVLNGVLLTAVSFVLHGGGTTTLGVDLDLSRSIHQANGMWIFSPVIGPVSVS